MNDFFWASAGTLSLVTLEILAVSAGFVFRFGTAPEARGPVA